MRLNIVTVFGTRPEAIKMAPLCRALRERSSEFSSTIIVTAQHRSMLDQVLSHFRLRADVDLNIMQANQSLDHIATSVLSRLGPALDRIRPDLVLVHGDTTTTFAAALSAFYRKIPVGHVEAGLRSYDYENPFPEESNRVLADHLCTLHFAPTAAARKNLLRERIPARGIFVTGNTVIDALRWSLKHQPGALPVRRLRASRLILLTAHRRENHGEPLVQVFRGLRRVVEAHPDTVLVYPVHLSPHVQAPAHSILGRHPRIHLIPPVDYAQMATLLKAATLVVTDSGGLQEEAPALGKPVLVLRKVTERPEAVRAGTARVIGVEEGRVFRSVSRLLSDPAAYRRMAQAVNPYGDGHAVPRIVDAIRYHFGLRKVRPKEFEGGSR